MKIRAMRGTTNVDATVDPDGSLKLDIETGDDSCLGLAQGIASASGSKFTAGGRKRLRLALPGTAPAVRQKV